MIPSAIPTVTPTSKDNYFHFEIVKFCKILKSVDENSDCVSVIDPPDRSLYIKHGFHQFVNRQNYNTKAETWWVTKIS